MSEINSNRKFIIVVGPTASGKTSLSVELCKAYNAMLVNADSLQMYKEVNIGTAKPKPEELLGIESKLFDYIPYPQKVTLGDYFREFKKTEESFKYKNFVISGGSGFYIRALEYGLFQVPKVPESIVKEIDKRYGIDGAKICFDQIIKLDPAYANKINSNDKYRVVRFLSVYEHTSKTYSQLNEEKTKQKPYLSEKGDLLKIVMYLPREELRKRVTQRTHNMFEQGWLSEVESLVKAEKTDWWPLSCIGYKEILEYLSGNSTIKSEVDLKELIIQKTMRLAKKQMTWIRKEENLHMMDASLSISEQLKIVHNWMNKTQHLKA